MIKSFSNSPLTRTQLYGFIAVVSDSLRIEMNLGESLGFPRGDRETTQTDKPTNGFVERLQTRGKDDEEKS
jgi:hypothetical protein